MKVSIHTVVFWVVTPCTPVDGYTFRKKVLAPYSRSLQGGTITSGVEEIHYLIRRDQLMPMVT
jgi:hypothetical protein